MATPQQITPPPAPASAATTFTTPAAVAGMEGGGVAVDESKVSVLVGMGFLREQAVGALSSTEGDAEQAAGLLLAQMDI